MKNKLKPNSKKGFTLVELVIVIAILAILAAVAIPVVTSIVGKAKKSAAMEQAAEIQQCVATCYAMESSPLDSNKISTVGEAMAYFNMDPTILDNNDFVYEPNKGKVYSILDDDKPSVTKVLEQKTPISYLSTGDGLLPGH